MDSNVFLYEVVLYRIRSNIVETIGSKFYKTTSPYKGKDCIVKKLRDYKIVKLVTQIN